MEIKVFRGQAVLKTAVAKANAVEKRPSTATVEKKGRSWGLRATAGGSPVVFKGLLSERWCLGDDVRDFIGGWFCPLLLRRFKFKGKHRPPA